MNLDAAITLLLALLTRATEISALIARARAQGRDRLTDDEWTQITAAADRAADALVEAIERAEAEGR